MKAAYFTAYGPVENLAIRNVPRPEPDDDEVLIKNHASSINFGNVGHVKGEPFLIRMFTGFGRPRYKIPGGDVAGVIVAVGSKVVDFKPGDKVIADVADSGFGAYAQYVAAKENVVVHKPQNLSFDEAATLPLAAAVAIAGLKNKGHIQAGQKVLVVGSTGSVGPFAVQVAKTLGAEVTAVCSGKHSSYVKSLGADHIIDYKKTDFAKQNKKYDLVAGIAGTRSMSDYKSVLAPNGTYINIGGTMKQFRNAFTTGPLLFMCSKKTFRMLMYAANKKDLLAVKEMAESGNIKPTVDKIFPLDEIIDAYKYYESRKASGKIVIKIQ